MADKIFDKLKEELPEIQKGVLLKDYTTFKIGGPAKYFFVAKNKEDLVIALAAAKKLKLPVFILGGGSNLLVSEKGFKGLVVKIDISDIKFHGSEAFVGAGADLTKLAYLSAENGFLGFEWASGIPGTVGGAIFGHAQAFGIKISELVKNVEAINIKTFEVKIFSKEQCQFSLKNSIFKKDKNLIIISAVFGFKKGDKEKIQEKIKKFMNYRKNRHPMNFPSAGSIFINPEVKIKNKKLIEKFPELNEFNEKGVIRAGYLIEKVDLKGKRIGMAQISKQHANFIVNLGNAKAEDVASLIKLAQKRVKKMFGISLETEVQIL